MKNNKQNSDSALKSFDDVNETLLNIAVLKLIAEKKETEMKQQLLNIKQVSEPCIKELLDKVTELESLVYKFCKTNKKLFSNQRSRALTYGRIGFRTGQAALKLTNTKKYTWEYVKEKFQDLFNTKYVTVEIKLDKTKILSDAGKDLLTVNTLENAGVKVVKSEKSFYEINWDEIKLVNE